MLPIDPNSAASMSEISSQLNLLILSFIGSIIIFNGVVIGIVKWYLPKRFEQQTEEREARLEALKAELDNKAAAEKVDIERDRMLPLLIENLAQSNRSTIQMAESFHVSITQGIQQTAANIAQLKAHDGQLTSNTEHLMKLAETVDLAVTNIQALKATVDKNTDQTKTAAAYGEKAAKVAEETLELVKKKIIQCVEETKSDTGELPKLSELKLASDPSKAASDYPVSGDGAAA